MKNQLEENFRISRGAEGDRGSGGSTAYSADGEERKVDIQRALRQESGRTDRGERAERNIRIETDETADRPWGFSENSARYRESAASTAQRHSGMTGETNRGYRAYTYMAEESRGSRSEAAAGSRHYEADTYTAEESRGSRSEAAERRSRRRYEADTYTAEESRDSRSEAAAGSRRYEADTYMAEESRGSRAEAPERRNRCRYEADTYMAEESRGLRSEAAAGNSPERWARSEKDGRWHRVDENMSAQNMGKRNGQRKNRNSRYRSTSRRSRGLSSVSGRQAGRALGGRLREEWRQFTAYVNESWRVRLLLALCALLLIGMVTKYATDRIFYQERDITDAFVVTDSGCLESRMQITVDYGTAFLTEHDKQALIGYLANSLGIRMEGAADYQENEVSQVYTYHKEAKQASTTIKAITLRQDTSRTYLYTELVIQNDVNFDILSYRDILLGALEDLQVVQAETTMQFLGAYDGDLPLERWNKIANSMIKELGGKIIYENRDKELYTIYAYSSQLPEYVSVDRNKINIQVAMRYEQDSDRTVVYLATPLLRGDW